MRIARRAVGTYRSAYDVGEWRSVSFATRRRLDLTLPDPLDRQDLLARLNRESVRGDQRLRLALVLLGRLDEVVQCLVYRCGLARR